MPAQFDKTAYTPVRRAIYMATARGFFAPLYSIYHRLTITGRENVPDGPFVAVGNHLSNADPPLLAVATLRPIAFIAKRELYEVPVLKQLILFYGAISVDRGKPEVSTFKAVKEVVKQGWSLGTFIEGTRNKTPGVLGQPREGAAYFARANKLPIVPVGIVGTNVRWGKAYARIGKPIEPSQDLSRTTWEIMEALSELTGFALPQRAADESQSTVL
jgi:1-acyl-sn-glycerol-3-phosphate acyltransferase